MIRSLLLILGVIWLIGLGWFYRQIPEAGKEVALPASIEAAVVLTGGEGRLKQGIEFLEAGKVNTLFISGVGQGVSLDALLASVNKSISESLRKRIVMDFSAIDTTGNAQETAKWIKANNVQSIVIITSNYHMPRAKAEFAKALPEVELYSYPVFTDGFDKDHWYEESNTFALLISEYVKYILVRALGPVDMA